MFEKDAEEKGVKYADSLKPSIEKFDDEEGYSWCQVEEGYENGFKEGAEFGYNKANEWHYPSKGEYPKDEKDMLMSEQLILLIKLKGTNNLSISIGQYNFSTQEFSYQHIVGLTDVIAWKEIVLPELPKEIE